MSVSYEGKSPGKLWYFMQKTKGIFATKQQKPLVGATTGTGASATATYLVTQQIGFVLAYLPIATAGLGGMAAYQAFRAIRPSDSDIKKRVNTQDRWVSAAKYAGAAAAAFLLTPVLTTWVSIGAVAATAYFGVRSYRSWQEGAKSMSVRNYVRDQEAAWLDHKKNGGFKNAMRRLKNHIKTAALQGGKWGGFTAAAAGLAASGLAAAQYAGAAILPAATSGSIVSAITTAGAAIGLGATAAVYGAVAIAAAVIPVGIVAGLVCRNKLREGAPANDNASGRKPFYKPLSDDITADVRKPANAPAPAQKLTQTDAAASFNADAPKAVAEEKPAAPKPAAKPAQDPERQKAAEARAAARRKR